MKFVIQMICKNEANRYLERVIQWGLNLTPHFYILDDQSNDNSHEIYTKYPQLTVVKSKYTYCGNSELVLRKRLFKTIMKKENPDLILSIDADDIYVGDIQKDIDFLMNQDEFQYINFPWFNMWNDEEHYILPTSYAPRLFKTRVVEEYIWTKQKYHVIPMPLNILKMNGKMSEFTKIKHLGYLSVEERNDRVERKMNIEDPTCKYFPKEDYLYYIDENKELLRWVD